VRPAALRTPRHPGGVPGLPEAVTREAYWHEVSSAGFWPGNQAFLGPPSIPMPIPNRPASESELQRRAPTSTRRPASLSCHMIGSERRQFLTPCCSIFCRPHVLPPQTQTIVRDRGRSPRRNDRGHCPWCSPAIPSPNRAAPAAEETQTGAARATAPEITAAPVPPTPLYCRPSRVGS